MTDDATLSIEDALLLLTGDRRIRPADVGLAHGSAARIRNQIALSPETRRRLHRTLAGYATDLADLGVDWAAVEVPEGATAATAAASPDPVGPIGRSRVWVEEGHLWLKSPYAARDIVRDRIGAASWRKRKVAYQLPATPAAALSIANALGAYGIDPDEAATALVLRGHDQIGAQAKRVAVDLPPVPGSKTDAWTHQRQAFWFAREMPGVILDVEMGGGKSKIICDLVHDSGAESVMVVCPERVVGVWPKQFGLHCGGEKHIIDPRRANKRGEWSLIPIKDRVAMYDHALHECRCGLPHVLLTNYSAAGHEPFASWSLRQRFDYLVYDECHRLRSPQGVWSKWAAAMHSRTERALGGTGTLQAQTPLDVFGPVRAVEPGVFGATFTGFRRRYAIMGGYENRVVQDLQNEAELAEKLSQVVYRAGEEILDLPTMLDDVTVTSHLAPKAYKAYKALESEMYAEVLRTLEDGTTVPDEVTADNVLVRILRCQQITGGALPLDSGEVEEIDTAKYSLLLDELEDIPASEPTVVFARFHHDLDKIRQAAEKMGRPYGELSGRRSDALTHDATLREGVAIAGVQLQAGGTGVDFTRSAFGIYYSVGHSLSDYLQTRKRLQRPGQTRSVRFRHLVLEGTIDVEVYAALAARESVTQRIINRVRALQASGGRL